MEKIEILCNRKVREYTTRQLKDLTGLSVSRAYGFVERERQLTSCRKF